MVDLSPSFLPLAVGVCPPARVRPGPSTGFLCPPNLPHPLERPRLRRSPRPPSRKWPKLFFLSPLPPPHSPPPRRPHGLPLVAPPPPFGNTNHRNRSLPLSFSIPPLPPRISWGLLCLLPPSSRFSPARVSIVTRSAQCRPPSSSSPVSVRLLSPHSCVPPFFGFVRRSSPLAKPLHLSPPQPPASVPPLSLGISYTYPPPLTSLPSLFPLAGPFFPESTLWAASLGVYGPSFFLCPSYPSPLARRDVPTSPPHVVCGKMVFVLYMVHPPPNYPPGALVTNVTTPPLSLKMGLTHRITLVQSNFSSTIGQDPPPPTPPPLRCEPWPHPERAPGDVLDFVLSPNKPAAVFRFSTTYLPDHNPTFLLLQLPLKHLSLSSHL